MIETVFVLAVTKQQGQREAHYTQRYRRLLLKKRYGVDNSHLGAFKATRHSTQIPQGPGYSRAFAGANEWDGLETKATKNLSISGIHYIFLIEDIQISK